ncbi:hypothetical protein ABZ743_32355, partial [Streptomyces sp. NPDC006662]|uniref:hypothetical protein n=1 Tax=Streptomyces sp. NPDC006662 TaxID=3156902 RepID=UPI0033C2A1C3
MKQALRVKRSGTRTVRSAAQDSGTQGQPWLGATAPVAASTTASACVLEPLTVKKSPPSRTFLP